MQKEKFLAFVLRKYLWDKFIQIVKGSSCQSQWLWQILLVCCMHVLLFFL